MPVGGNAKLKPASMIGIRTMCVDAMIPHSMCRRTRTAERRLGTHARRSVLVVSVCFSIVSILISPTPIRAQTDTANPLLRLSINHTRDTTVFRGMPLLVRLSVIHPAVTETNAVPIILAPDPGPWSNAVIFQFTGSTGPLPLWPMVPMTPPAATATIDATNYVQHSWWLPPNQTATMATGTYVLKAALTITNASVSGGWTGKVSSLTATVAMVDEPAALSEDEAFTKMSCLSDYERSFGQSQAAIARVEAFLLDYPTNIGALWMKAL